MVSDGVCEGCVFGPNQAGCVGAVVVGAVFPLPYLNFFDRRVSTAAVVVANEARFEEAYEIGFMCRGTQRRREDVGGEYSGTRG